MDTWINGNIHVSSTAHGRSCLVISQECGLTSSSVSVGYCFPERGRSALIALLISPGSLFIFEGILLSLRLRLCVLSASSGSCAVCQSSRGLYVQINFMAGFIVTPSLLIHQIRCDVDVGTQQSSEELVHLLTFAGLYNFYPLPQTCRFMFSLPSKLCFDSFY